MSERVRRHLPSIKRLQRMNAGSRKKYLASCSQDFVDTLCECCKNLLNENIPIRQTQLKKLKRHKLVLRKLANKKTSSEQRRKILQQKGGFLGLLIKPLIGLAGSLLGGGLFNREQR